MDLVSWQNSEHSKELMEDFLSHWITKYKSSLFQQQALIIKLEIKKNN